MSKTASFLATPTSGFNEQGHQQKLRSVTTEERDANLIGKQTYQKTTNEFIL
jgi:hypothetical protein